MQAALAEAKFSCRGDTVRTLPPADQARSLGDGRKGRLPLDGLLDPSHPVISFLLGVGVNLVHLRAGRRSTDEEHASLLISHFSSDELLKGDNGWLLVLQEKDVQVKQHPVYSEGHMQRIREGRQQCQVSLRVSSMCSQEL